jgi:hypothetical protein
MKQGFPEGREFVKYNYSAFLCQTSKFRDAMWVPNELFYGLERRLYLDCLKREPSRVK